MTDSSVFSCLPIAVRDSLLQQAFQLLDQPHMFGVAPRVCRLWHQLAVSIIGTSLKVIISRAEAAKQFAMWMQNHGTTLQSLDLQLSLAVCHMAELQFLLQSVGGADQLRSLTISAPFSLTMLDIPLLCFTSLVSLRIEGCVFKAGSLCDAIPCLTTLNSLSLDTIYGDVPWGPFLQQIATSLVKLTSL